MYLSLGPVPAGMVALVKKTTGLDQSHDCAAAGVQLQGGLAIKATRPRTLLYYGTAAQQTAS